MLRDRAMSHYHACSLVGSNNRVFTRRTGAGFDKDNNFRILKRNGTPCERPSAETLFELICTWLHKGNYCESATEHDQPETEGPVERLTKKNLHGLYVCQSNVFYGRSQLIDADILFYFNSTRGLEFLNTGIYDMNDKRKEKVLEGEEISQPDGLSIECIVHEALESPQYRSSGAERMHDGLVVPPMPTAPMPPILEVTVSRPLNPICRIASQLRTPEPLYTSPPPPPLPTLHGVHLLCKLFPPPPARPPPDPPHTPLVYVEPAPPPPPHPFILVTAARFFNTLTLCLSQNSVFVGSLGKLLLERPSSVGYLRSIAEMKATNIFENGKTASVESNAYEDPNSYKIQNEYDLPRMPHWFSSSGNQKLCQSLAGILRLVSLSLVAGKLVRQASTAVCILNEMVFGLSDQAVDNMKSMFRNSISGWDVSLKRDLRSQLIDSISSILHVYLSPEIWNLPLEQSNVVMIDGIGIFNLSLNSDFVSSGFLHSSLYVGHLVLANSDYVIDSIFHELRHLDLNPHFPSVLASILSYIGVAHKLPLMEEHMHSISQELEILGRHKHPELTTTFLKVEVILDYVVTYFILRQKTMNGVDDVDHSSLEDNADKYKEQLEVVFFKLKEIKSYIRTVGSISISCITTATPLLSSLKQTACLIALDIVEDGIVALTEVEESYKPELRAREVKVVVLEMIAEISGNKKSALAYRSVVKKRSLNALRGLASIDPDLIWLLLADVYYSKNKEAISSQPPVEDLPPLFQLVLPPSSLKSYLYVQYGRQSYGF
ncbi:hypothetical protein Tco_1104582 [Tanacetum coccineum]